MHITATVGVDPFKATYSWREKDERYDARVFLHLGEPITILLSPDDLLALHLVLAAAIDDMPRQAQAPASSAHSRSL
jgi:hypothetical protein